MFIPAITAATLAAAASAEAKDHEAKAKLPNILCIVCEDISCYLGCYGDPNAVTPNLDRLATESVRYTNMHTCVGVSSPSRFSLITGLYASAMGANNMRNTGSPKHLPKGLKPYSVVLPDGVKCYSEYMREAGYYCTNGPKSDYQFAVPSSAWDECGGGKTHWKHRPEGMPFFSIFNLNVTHEDLFWNRADVPLTVDPEKLILPPYLPDTPTVRQDMAVLYSNISVMDRQVADLIEEVREAGLLDDTIIIWYSDNGGPHARGKREIYLSGTNVPFMIRYPDGHGAGTVENRLCMFVDVPPTIMSLAGLKAPSYMHGRAFAGIYNTPERKYVYGARDRMDERIDKQGGIFDGRYHYIRNYHPERSDFLDCEYQNNAPMVREMIELHKQGRLTAEQDRWFASPRPEEEFYDTQADPYELHDISSDPAQKKNIARLRKEYGKWVSKYNRDWFIPELEMYRRFCPGGVPRKVEDPVITMEEGLVSISTTTPGASIVYRKYPEQIKGRWILYTAPFRLKDGERIEAKADRIGYTDSGTVSAAAE